MTDHVYVPPFTTGSILNTGFGVLFSRIGPILLASILVHLPLLLFVALSTPQGVLDYLSSPILSAVVGMAMSFILAGAVSVLVVVALKGEGGGVGFAFGTALKRLLSIIGVTILLALIVGIPAGIMFLIAMQLGMIGAIVVLIAMLVLVLILLAQFFVAVPVVVMEREDPFSALGISSDLTRGRRASIIGAMIVLGIILFVVSWIVGKIMEGSVTSIDGLKPAMYVGTAVDILIGAIGPVMAAAAYYLLAAPEGRIADVFD
jgi:hypothetical protein